MLLLDMYANCTLGHADKSSTHDLLRAPHYMANGNLPSSKRFVLIANRFPTDTHTYIEQRKRLRESKQKHEININRQNGKEEEKINSKRKMIKQRKIYESQRDLTNRRD